MKIETSDQALPLILHIDDSETDTDLNVMAMKKARFVADLKCFMDAHSALDFLRKSMATNVVPSLMILDLKMSEMNGFELLAIMNQAGMKKFPVVVMSGSSLPEDVFKAKQLGADAYYEKPILLRENYSIFEEIKNTFLSNPPSKNGQVTSFSNGYSSGPSGTEGA